MCGDCFFKSLLPGYCTLLACSLSIFPISKYRVSFLFPFFHTSKLTKKNTAAPLFFWCDMWCAYACSNENSKCVCVLHCHCTALLHVVWKMPACQNYPYKPHFVLQDPLQKGSLPCNEWACSAKGYFCILCVSTALMAEPFYVKAEAVQTVHLVVWCFVFYYLMFLSLLLLFSSHHTIPTTSTPTHKILYECMPCLHLNHKTRKGWIFNGSSKCMSNFSESRTIKSKNNYVNGHHLCVGTCFAVVYF